MTDGKLGQIGGEDPEKAILRKIGEIRGELELAKLTAPPRALELIVELHRLQGLLARSIRQPLVLLEEGWVS